MREIRPPIELARDLFGLDATATALHGEENLNYRLDSGQERFVLKIHADPSPLEDAALRHLDAVPGVPRLIGSDGHVRLLSWLDGAPWADAPGDMASLGRLVARVDRALRDFTHPDSKRPLRWNLLQAPEFGI